MMYWKRKEQRKEKRSSTERRPDFALCMLLAGAALFFCWYEIGRHGIFGSSVDWISQHSVIPDYFRKQFYSTGDFFPDFALGLGGGQNIYNFAYYGLYSPLLLPSYLLPFVKMGDYLMAVSALVVAASGVVFYCWQRSLKKSQGLCFAGALLLILSGPLIFQSARQVMFVNYMPFLCMALWGTDRFFKRNKSGLYLFGVFLMILTSFYYSIAGILVLVIYGVHRYLWYREHPEEIPEASSFFRGKGWLADGIRFLLPIVTAVMLSAFFLLPTAAALIGKRGGGSVADPAALLRPQLSFFPHLYSAYGVGLTTLFVTALFAGLFRRGWSSRVLIWSCIAALSVPAFWWLLNGGLYVREKALIPFLPLFCYVIVCCCESRKGWYGALPYLATVFVLYRESGYPVEKYAVSAQNLVEKVLEGGYLARIDRWLLVLLEACFMLIWYLLLCCLRRRRFQAALLAPPILFLALFGSSFCDMAGIESREFYDQVTDQKTEGVIKRILEEDDGFYRIEQLGSSSERAANVNRIWDPGQYISSVYSSSYNSSYQEFRMETFDVEEPAANFMGQRVSDNPVFRKLMGVKYLINRMENNEKKAAETPPGYELYFEQDGFSVYRNQAVAELCYATDRLIPQETYQSLPFPLRQTVLEQYAVVPDTGMETEGGAVQKTAEELQKEQGLVPLELSFQESEEEQGKIQKIADGYRIEAKKSRKVQAGLAPAPQKDGVIFLQFQIKNEKPQSSVSIGIKGIQNTLSQKSGAYFYYNHNTVFTYAVPVSGPVSELEVNFGKGKYEITGISCWWKELAQESGLYRSEFQPDREKTKGDRIEGQIDVQTAGYVITSIPYDENFEIKADGERIPAQKVNTAFLGFPVGKGKHRIEIVYHAPGAAPGKLLSLLGIAMATWQLPGAKRRKRKMQ